MERFHGVDKALPGPKKQDGTGLKQWQEMNQEKGTL